METVGTELTLQKQISPNLQAYFSNLPRTEGLVEFQSFGVKNCERTEKEIFILTHLKTSSYLPVKSPLEWYT